MEISAGCFCDNTPALGGENRLELQNSYVVWKAVSPSQQQQHLGRHVARLDGTVGISRRMKWFLSRASRSSRWFQSLVTRRKINKYQGSIHTSTRA